jgi:hypothetical protein
VQACGRCKAQPCSYWQPAGTGGTTVVCRARPFPDLQAAAGESLQYYCTRKQRTFSARFMTMSMV